MAAVKIKADGSIVLPKEARHALNPRRKYEAIRMGDSLMIAPASNMTLQEFLSRTNDGVPAPSDEQIQEWIEKSRRQRRRK